MFSRRPYPRMNRGRVRRAAAAATGIPLAGTWNAGHWFADDGPVDAGGGAVSTWVPNEGADNLEQSTSADRPTLSTTTKSGGRTTVDGDGSSDFLHDDGTIGAKFTGDQSFTRYWHVQI